MLQYMKAVRGLAYEETPDYDALDVLLEAMQKAGGGKGTAAAKGGGRSSRSAARGATPASSSTAAAAKSRASSAKRGKGKPKETPEVEVCEVIIRGSAKRMRQFFRGGRGMAACGKHRFTCHSNRVPFRRDAEN